MVMIKEKKNKKVLQCKWPDRPRGESFGILLMSDIHIDSIHCDRNLFKEHLEYAKANDLQVFIIGDLFDAMQGKNDRRGSKQSTKSEFLLGPYFDQIVNDACEFLLPYVDNIAMIGEGNHETAITRHNEIDLLDRLCYKLNNEKDDKSSRVEKMGYDGYILIKSNRYENTGVMTRTIKFHHGSGGGAVVSGGTIDQYRDSSKFPQADIVIGGHIHQYGMRMIGSEKLDKRFNVVEHQQFHLRSSTYKGHGTWETEKKFQPVSKGCWEVTFTHAKPGILKIKCATLN